MLTPREITPGAFWSLRDEDAGVCASCGEYVYGVEPDAERDLCENCGRALVYGLETALELGILEVQDREDYNE